MPKATVSNETVRKELQTCPGGWVELRQLPFGQMLVRRDKASRMIQEVRPNAKKTDVQHVEFDILHEWANRYDFKHCIVDHNLEDEDGNKLDFSNGMTLQVLDPKIGAEIEKYIDELNQEEFDEEGFTPQSDSNSKEETPQSSIDSDLSETPSPSESLDAVKGVRLLV